MGPELVTGRLEDIASACWRNLETELRSLHPLPHAANMTADKWQLLMSDYHSGQACVVALLRLKTIIGRASLG
eukprot:5102155-Alexandrium_andersonii.AAC.1